MEQRRRKDGATQDLHECVLRISMALPAVRPAFFCCALLALPIAEPCRKTSEYIFTPVVAIATLRHSIKQKEKKSDVI
jgi:hypothetical protein